MKTYYVVVAEHEEESYTFVVAPGVKLIEEARSLDQIERDVAEKGHDMSYCSEFYGMREQHKEEVRREIAKYLREWKNVSVPYPWSLRIEPKLRINIA